MRLSDLEPRLHDGVLTFNCPKCKDHRVRVALKPATDYHGRSWSYTGHDFETFTLHPSIDVGCWHGCLIEGGVTFINGN